MPIRTVKQQSDRGKFSEPQDQPLPSELRMKRLFEYAQINKDKDLQSALGFITTDYIADKNAIPLSAYRIRQIVNDIKSKSPGKIEQLVQQFTGCFSETLDPEAQAYWNNKKARVKTASARKPIFWRARKS